MSLFQWATDRTRTLEWYDVSLIKTGSALFVLMVAKLWPPLLSLDWYWYGALFVLVSIVPFYKYFIKKETSNQTS